MDTTDPTQPGPPSMTPPVELDEVPEKPTAWPKVIGVLAIIFGVLGALNGCWGTVSPLFMNFLTSMVPEEQRAAMAFMQDWAVWIVILSIPVLGLGVWLLVGGIGLVRRRPWARNTCLVWAVLKMVYVVVGSIFGYQIQQAQFQAMMDNPDMPANMGGFMQTMGVFSIVIGIVGGWALPIFMLIWLSRAKIKAETTEWPLQREQVI